MIPYGSYCDSSFILKSRRKCFLILVCESSFYGEFCRTDPKLADDGARGKLGIFLSLLLC